MTAAPQPDPMRFTITFGDRLRRARLALGLDQRHLAEGIDVHHATISRYEVDGGRDDAATRRLASLIEARYGVSADWLLYGKEDDTPQVTGGKVAVRSVGNVLYPVFPAVEDARDTETSGKLAPVTHLADRRPKVRAA